MLNILARTLMIASRCEPLDRGSVKTMSGTVLQGKDDDDCRCLHRSVEDKATRIDRESRTCQSVNIAPVLRNLP
ncbi:hypothetical protein [Labrenzia sp. R5_0]|uniref:hypothetical protein n=1 Tax=Labrenzia sp. R5_0 TaxID=2821108 RepID=UPI001ADCE33A|nr:hypothetical protein [Labrenzia sp. R5_0]MBO9460720.1 hypothetical protein [Labrenzia sp. R5_0]